MLRSHTNLCKWAILDWKSMNTSMLKLLGHCIKTYVCGWVVARSRLTPDRRGRRKEYSQIIRHPRCFKLLSPNNLQYRYTCLWMRLRYSSWSLCHNSFHIHWRGRCPLSKSKQHVWDWCHQCLGVGTLRKADLRIACVIEHIVTYILQQSVIWYPCCMYVAFYSIERLVRPLYHYGGCSCIRGIAFDGIYNNTQCCKLCEVYRIQGPRSWCKHEMLATTLNKMMGILQTKSLQLHDSTSVKLLLCFAVH